MGRYLVKALLSVGNQVTSVDIKGQEELYQVYPKAKNFTRDLSLLGECEKSTEDINEIYNLAADMGGMRFIENNKAACMLSILINTHLLMAAKDSGVKRFFIHRALASITVVNETPKMILG